MDAQQLHDYIINPTHEYMDCIVGNNYNSRESRFLSLCTSAIESNCGDKVVQDEVEFGKGGLSAWQMEPPTHDDIWTHCDALKNDEFGIIIDKLSNGLHIKSWLSLPTCPMYACAMARLKYAMDDEALPSIPDSGIKGLMATDAYLFWLQYKRIYNSKRGASTFEKWQRALNDNRIFDVDLGE